LIIFPRIEFIEQLPYTKIKEDETMAFEKLFKPIKIGAIEIKNRYTLAPYNFLFQDWTGLVSDEEIAHCIARAKGEAGLLIFGACCCTKLGVKKATHPFPFLTDYTQLPRLAQLTESVHLCGSKIFIQVLPSTGSRYRALAGEQPIAPSAIPYLLPKKFGRTEYLSKIMEERLTGRWLREKYLSPFPVPRELSVEEIQRDIIEESALNCKLAVVAGFDGVEVHTCHHYLIDQFRDPRLNKRTDQYGGSRENRDRIVRELVGAIVRSVKEERSDVVVGVRVGSECAEGGYTLEETKILAKELQELGIDYYSVTRGVPETVNSFAPKAEDGGFLRYSRELKKVLKIPVMTPFIHNPKLAEQAVSEGWTDIVASGRPFIADPEFAKKVKENRINEIRKCTMCGYCYAGAYLALPNRCEVNPEVGRERYNPKYQLLEGYRGAAILPYVLRKPAGK
jgi:2,4-dienoyl-CoA reductase-like NADH-dependent reductase (Old Yellow Enzyme family)